MVRDAEDLHHIHQNSGGPGAPPATQQHAWCPKVTTKMLVPNGDFTSKNLVKKKPQRLEFHHKLHPEKITKTSK
jgi:hypothetical protein